MSGGWFGARAALVAVGVVVAMVFGVSGASAATLTVCESGPPTCSYTSIQEAINAAAPGSKIVIAAGTYEGRLEINKNVKLRGAGADETVISGGGVLRGGVNGGVVSISSPAQVKITGVTITGGFVEAGRHGGSGGGVYNSGTLTLSSSVIDNNTVTSTFFGGPAGGGIYSTGTLELKRTSVSDNSASSNEKFASDGVGGGIDAAGGEVTLKESIVRENLVGHGELGGEGAGIANVGATVTVSASTISANGGPAAVTESSGTPYEGGGIYTGPGATTDVVASRVSKNIGYDGGGISSRGTTIVKGGSLTENEAWQGGAVAQNEGNTTLEGSFIGRNKAQAVGGISGGAVTVNGCRVEGNSADAGGGVAAIDLTMNSSVVIRNSATLAGGGVVLEGGTITDSRVVRNTAAYGGGIFVEGESSPVVLTGTKITRNSATEKGGGIFNEGDLTGSKDSIVSNTAPEGPSIFNEGGTVALIESIVEP